MTVLHDAWRPASLAARWYLRSSKEYLRHGQLLHVVSPFRLLNLYLELSYIVLQIFIVLLYKAVRVLSSGWRSRS
jgi:hypothetical protein